MVTLSDSAVYGQPWIHPKTKEAAQKNLERANQERTMLRKSFQNLGKIGQKMQFDTAIGKGENLEKLVQKKMNGFAVLITGKLPVIIITNILIIILIIIIIIIIR